jgi:hypothetical protein
MATPSMRMPLTVVRMFEMIVLMILKVRVRV